jgi:hypothetical protein
MLSPVFRLSERIACVPVVHGSGDFAIAVRRLLLNERFDRLAVPLPPSFQADVERAIDRLPAPTVVVQRELPEFSPPKIALEETDKGDDDSDEDDLDPGCSYVPIDPCQAVIAALRSALAERIPRSFIDLEVNRYRPLAAPLPDPYALKQVAHEKFAAAILPALQRPTSELHQARIAHMAGQLRQLEAKSKRILCLCSIHEWPWLREAYQEQTVPAREADTVTDTEWLQPDPLTLLFLLGELPFITALYERARRDLEDDENLSVDGVKELLIASRTKYRAELQRRARKITPHLLRQTLKYARNLSLLERRLTPDLYTLVVAAKQTCGDAFAAHLAETARDYGYTEPLGLKPVKLGVDSARLPDGEQVRLFNRLPGAPLIWRSCELQRRPQKPECDKWQMRWNPFSQCSWPPEDEAIERFRAHCFDRALAVMGADLARTEKFTTSIMDGVDIRDTLRHWYEESIYVKILPPSRGRLDSVVMLFDSPADPRTYPWRTTWYAEHQEESTLAFFATDFSQELVGPGIALASYGGALFIYPPIAIPDIWTDETLDFVETLEERLLAAACRYSQCPTIAVVSSAPPGAGWRSLAQRFRKKLVHLPLGQFSDGLIQQLRMVHVLNGKQVRSYASDFIRKA